MARRSTPRRSRARVWSDSSQRRWRRCPGRWRCRTEGRKGGFSDTPEPHIAFRPIFVHPLFPVFEPHIQKWVIFVRRRPCVCDEVPEKRSILAPTPSFPFPRGPRHLTFPSVKNDVAQKTKKSVFLRKRRRPKAGDAFTRTRLMPTFRVSAERPAEGPKVGVQVFSVFRVFRVSWGVLMCFGVFGCVWWCWVLGVFGVYGVKGVKGVKGV